MPYERKADRWTLAKGAPDERTMINTALDPLGIPDDRTPIDSMTDSIRGMLGDCFDDSHPYQQAFGHGALSIYNYLSLSLT